MLLPVSLLLFPNTRDQGRETGVKPATSFLPSLLGSLALSIYGHDHKIP